jgi:transposase InsO family protein
MTAAEIAEVLSLALSTVSLWLKRIGLGKRSRLQPAEPPNRYERRHAGELVHVDIKQLGRISERGAGHRMVGHRKSQSRTRVDGVKRGLTRVEYVHVMIDDHSRLAYAEVPPTLRASCAIDFLRREVSWFEQRGVQIKAVMSDNGSAYVAHSYRAALAELGLLHLRIRPYRPRTNGKQRDSSDARQRVGLRAHLRQLIRTSRSTAPVPRALQLQATPRLARPSTARVTADERR